LADQQWSAFLLNPKKIKSKDFKDYVAALADFSHSQTSRP
jgi:hypothetical protein